MTGDGLKNLCKQQQPTNSSEITSFWTPPPLGISVLRGEGGGVRGGGMDIFWNYTIQKKCNFPAQNIVLCLLFLMIVDKFDTHTCISWHTLCLIISTQFTTD